MRGARTRVMGDYRCYNRCKADRGGIGRNRRKRGNERDTSIRSRLWSSSPSYPRTAAGKRERNIISLSHSSSPITTPDATVAVRVCLLFLFIPFSFFLLS